MRHLPNALDLNCSNQHFYNSHSTQFQQLVNAVTAKFGALSFNCFGVSIISSLSITSSITHLFQLLTL
jgi:hypothetical protein